MVDPDYRTDPQGWYARQPSHHEAMLAAYLFERELAAERDLEQRNAARRDRRTLAAFGPSVTPSEAAKLLGVSPTTVRRWLGEGRVEGVQLSTGEWRLRG
jgi:excisionase family DNA binding protein